MKEKSFKSSKNHDRNNENQIYLQRKNIGVYQTQGKAMKELKNVKDMSVSYKSTQPLKMVKRNVIIVILVVISALLSTLLVKFIL